MSSAILNPYNGNYKANDETMIEMKTEGDALKANIGNNTFKLFAASETDFYLTSFFFKLHFINDDKGNVSGFQLDRYGSSEFINKIN